MVGRSGRRRRVCIAAPFSLDTRDWSGDRRSHAPAGGLGVPARTSCASRSTAPLSLREAGRRPGVRVLHHVCGPAVVRSAILRASVREVYSRANLIVDVPFDIPCHEDREGALPALGAGPGGPSPDQDPARRGSHANHRPCVWPLSALLAGVAPLVITPPRCSAGCAPLPPGTCCFLPAWAASMAIVQLGGLGLSI